MLLLVNQNKIHNILIAFLAILKIYFIIVHYFKLLYGLHVKLIHRKFIGIFHVKFISHKNKLKARGVHIQVYQKIIHEAFYVIFKKVESSDAIWYIN